MSERLLTIIGTYLFQLLGAVILALILSYFHRTHRRKFLLHWSLSWWAISIYLLSAATAYYQSYYLSAVNPIRILTSTVSLSAGYLQIALLLCGTYELINEKTISKDFLKKMIALTVVFSLIMCLLYINAPAFSRERFVARVGLRSFFAWAGFWFGAFYILRKLKSPRGAGATILLSSLLLYGLEQLQYFLLPIIGIISYGGLPYTMLFGAIDFSLQCLMGLGMVIWLLDEEKKNLKAASKAFLESEERYRRLAENSAVGIWHVDNKGYTIYCNPIMSKMLELDSIEELKGTTYHAFFTKESNRRILTEHEKKRRGEFSNYEAELIGKQGGNRSVFISSACIFDSEDKLLGVIGAIADITDMKKAEDALQKRTAELEETKKFLDSIIYNLPTALFVKEASELRVVRCNRAYEELTGLCSADLMGKTVHEIYPKDMADSFNEQDRTVLSTGEMLDIPEETVTYPQKGARILHTRKVPIIGSDEKPKYLLGIAEDISEHKTAEAKIKTSLKEKEILLKEIHHRVKNNLQVISSLLSLQAGYCKDESALELFKDSQNRIRTMALIHERLYQSNDLTKIDFAEYVAALASSLFRSYKISTNVVLLDVRVDGLVLGIDKGIPCGLIINELVSNALKYAFPQNRKGSILITLKTENDRYVLTVADDGIGFPKELDFRNTETLGLQLVTTLTDQLGGEIELKNEIGSIFKIAFKD